MKATVTRLTFLAVLCSLLAIAGAQSSQCLYCKRIDSRAAFLEFYSYCYARDTCLKDQWLYFNQGCDSSWKLGRDTDLNLCNATLSTCPSFISKSQLAGIQTNHSQTLAKGQKCEVKVDATAFVGRVVFDNQALLGVEIDGYRIGEAHTIDGGSVENITVFNGDANTDITFIISFSQGFKLVADALLSVLALGLYAIAG